MANADAQKLKELLVENGRAHLQVREEEGALVVHSSSDLGADQNHFRLAPSAKGYEVAFWDNGKWRAVPLAGKLDKVVGELVASGRGPRLTSDDSK